MDSEEMEALRRYHAERCRQEMRELQAARSEEAADAHRGLMRLHELMYYDLVLPTFIAARPEEDRGATA